ncbi:MAG: hypothetical protein MJ252_08430 [archaeon]|nr:hypothetical protein [archaeon]
MEINSEKISSKPIVIATCPIKGCYEYIVTGTYNPSMNNSNNLSLYIFNTRSSKEPVKLLCTVPTSKNFCSIAWTPLGEDTEEHGLGYVLAGHSDGCISIWDITKIISNSNNEQISEDFGMVNSSYLTNGEITSIAINEKPHIFAFASSNVALASINSSTMDITIATNCEQIPGGQVSCLSWNLKVNHILAAATTEGKVFIYNMKNGSLFVTIMDQQLIEDHQVTGNGEPIHTTAFWTLDGAQIIIAYDDPEYNFLTQYHMKQPNAPSALYQNGHSNSIIDISRNSVDKNFVLSLGRDNIATCWSLRAGRPLSQIILKEKCCNLLWVNKIPDCFLAVGFNGKIWAERINFSEDMSIYTEGNESIPNWIGRKSGCSFAFGGKLYKFSVPQKSVLSLLKLSGNKKLIEEVQNSNKKIDNDNLEEFLDEKISQAESENKTGVAIYWAALKSIYTKNPAILYEKCGFDKNQIEDTAALALGKNRKKLGGNRHMIYQPQIEEEDVNSLFEKPAQKEEPKIERKKSDIYENPNTIQETIERNINWNVGTEKLIKQNLITGNLQNAVELLFKLNRDSEALLIASSQPELFEKAQSMFYSKTKDLYVKSMFPSIIKNNFELLFDYNYQKEWKEYLLYAKTYLANPQEFQNFAEKLGDKLSNNPDIYSALICYVCAENYVKVVDLLYQNYLREVEKYSKEDKKFLLHNLFEKAHVAHRILNSQNRISNDNYNKIIYDYCFLLIDEGLNVEASKYLLNLRGMNMTIDELYDRVYYNCEYALQNNFPKPNCPYNIAPIRSHRSNSIKNRGGNIPGVNQNQNLRNANNQRNIPQNPSPNQNKSIQFNRANNPPAVKQPIQNKPHPQAPFNQPHQFNPQNNPSNAYGGYGGRGGRPPVNTFNPAQPPKPVMENAQPMENSQISQGEAPKKATINFGGSRPGVTAFSKPPQFKPVNPPRPAMNPPSGNQSKINNPPKFNQPNQFNYSENNQMNPQQNFASNRFPQTQSPFPQQNNPKTNANPQMNNPSGNEMPSEDLSEMNPNETEVYNYFENEINVYNAAYPDENKRRDFGGKVNTLLNKLQHHEIKPDLLQLLKEFIRVNETSQNRQQEFKKLQWKIQSHDWDKNKSWMPLLGKLINMKR